jgi:predicted nucleic-acid-binding protein
MIGIDTNILLRFFEQDDPTQFAQVKKLVQSQAPVFISDVVLAEFTWVCKSQFGLSKPEICKRLEAIAESNEFEFAHKPAVKRAVEEFLRRKCDFADCLIAETNIANGCTTTMTFDTGAAKSDASTLMEA